MTDTPCLNVDAIEKFILSLEDDPNSLDFLGSLPLRMGCLYWSLNSLKLCGKLNLLDNNNYNERDGESAQDCTNESEEKSHFSLLRSSRNEIVKWIWNCRHPCGAFSSERGHQPTLISTFYAILNLVLLEKFDGDWSETVQWVLERQTESGAFANDEFGEIDSRMPFLAFGIGYFTNALNKIDVSNSVSWILRCKNSDGAFGSIPGAESHAAYTHCCVNALAIVGCLHLIDQDKLGKWLCDRQLTLSGGFNGRPEKAPDVCYSWWIYSNLITISRSAWIDKKELSRFILACQDENGGFADRPGNVGDNFHTNFALAALSAMKMKFVLPSSDSFSNVFVLEDVHPVFCIAEKFIFKNK